MNQTVTAKRGNDTRVFTQKTWDDLGTDKYGWALEPETPKEVADLIPDGEENDFFVLPEVADLIPEEQPAQIPVAIQAQPKKAKK